MKEIIIWCSLLEAVSQLNAEGKEFKVKPDEIMEKWGNNEAQDRVDFVEDEDGFTIEIKPEEEM